MNKRGIILILVALVAAGGAALLARLWIDSQRGNVPVAAAPAPRQEQRILVAARPLSIGAFLRAEDLRWQPWPEGPLPPTYLRQGARPLEDYVGALVRQPVAAGEPLIESKLVLSNARGFLAAVLEPGERAISLAVTPTSGVAGLIHPGDRVDLILTQSLPGEGRARRVSETIARNLRVIAIDQKVEGKPGEAIVGRTASLALTPKQAELVAVAAEMGQVHLALRSLAGEAASEEARASPTYDRDISAAIAEGTRRRPAERVKPPPPPRTTLTVLRGKGRESVREVPGGPSAAAAAAAAQGVQAPLDRVAQP
ncbi:MAG: Flp pilus assembly protein CpaB [Alphaproteobacteria bacterium]|nr:Flp pilus assembly protein CpaB [Alphaproteobacteria bacterium]